MGKPIKLLAIFYTFMSITAPGIAQPVTNGIISAYMFNGNANDNFGNNHGQVFGATLTSDRFGNSNSAYYFDGIDDFIQISNTPELNFAYNQDFTISIWVKFEALQNDSAGHNNEIIGQWNTNTNTGYPFAIRYWNNRANMSDAGRFFALRYDSRYCGHNPTITQDCPGKPDEWHHIAYVKSDSVLWLYVNGLLTGTAIDNTSSSCNTTNSNPIYIGKRDTNRRYFTGSIDDIVFYNRSLSDTEINTLLNEKNWQPPLPPAAINMQIIKFDIPGQIESRIDSTRHEILIKMPCYTDLSALTPTFTITSGTLLLLHNKTQYSGISTTDFRSPQTYKQVSLNNCDTIYWDVTVFNDTTSTPPINTNIYSFEIPGQLYSRIDSANNLISVTMPCYNSTFWLTPIFQLSPGSELYVRGNYQLSGITAHSFTAPITYYQINPSFCDTVKWVVLVESSVTEPEIAMTATSFNSLWLAGQYGYPEINPDNNTILITTDCWADIKALLFQYYLPPGTVLMSGNSPLPSGNTVDFSHPLLIKLVNDSLCSSQDWLIEVVQKSKTEQIDLKEIPNVITPNHDGKNDYFVVGEMLQGARLSVFNRYGLRVFYSESYKNEFNGKNLSPGYYFYVIEDNCLQSPIKGWLAIKN